MLQFLGSSTATCAATGGRFGGCRACGGGSLKWLICFDAAASGTASTAIATTTWEIKSNIADVLNFGFILDQIT